MLVREVMTEPVVTVPRDSSLEDAVELMVSNGIGCVVVQAGGSIVGIVTETDVLIAGLETGRSLDKIDVETGMSEPLITIGPEATLRAAAELMKTEAVKKLPVFEGMDLVGIATQQDIVFAHPELIQEAIHLEERRQDWERDLPEE